VTSPAGCLLITTAEVAHGPTGLWSPFLEHPDRAGILTDYDGTLAPIVEDRRAAVPLPEVPQVLSALSGRFAVVGVISGRPVSYLASRLPCGPKVILAGLYGLEQRRGSDLRVHPDAHRWRAAVEAIALAAEQGAPDGVEVERKGLAVAIHLRRRPDLMGWAEDWSTEQARSRGLVAQVGRMSVEVLPPLAIDKGSLVEELSATLDAVCFFGDDAGDIPAFSALRRMREAGKATVAVGVASSEQPSDLAGAVDLLVDGPEEAVALLTGLAGERRLAAPQNPQV
jgi:trehalose 6-phosphate phosphatase